MYRHAALLCLLLLLAWSFSAARAGKTQIAGEMGLEARLFRDSPADSRQKGDNLSLYLKPEFYRKFSKSWSVTFRPFIRLDQHDKQRSHRDIRELMFHKVAKTWELKLGISKVFWGVTETQHLVDIINQTDAVEAPDGEEKLGQPMLNLILKRKWGTTSLFVLPYFRERTFPGYRGRLRTIPLVDTTRPLYESKDGQNNIDYAVRWFKTIGPWDIGLSHFNGTSRIPDFVAGTNASGEAVLIPFYKQMNQTGLDLQLTKGSWLWKLEVIHRRDKGSTYAVTPYTALTGGFEYTRTGVFKTRADLGLLVEYLYDDRDDPTKTPFDSDVMFGARLTFNDVASTQLLGGIVLDTGTSERAYFVEFSRRIGQSYKLAVEARISSNAGPASPLYSLRNDDMLQIEFIKYF